MQGCEGEPMSSGANIDPPAKSIVEKFHTLHPIITMVLILIDP
jgi:hypothetical protein